MNEQLQSKALISSSAKLLRMAAKQSAKLAKKSARSLHQAVHTLISKHNLAERSMK